MLEIDGQNLSVENFNSELFSKGMLYAWNGYDEQKLTFEKKGSDLKSIIYAKKYQLEEKKGMYMKKMAAMATEIQESKSGSREGHVDNIDNYMDYELPHDTVKDMTAEEKVAYREFEDARYMYKRCEEDLKTVETLLKHLEDDKKYTVNLKQLQSIEKSDVLNEAIMKGHIANEFPSYGSDKLTFKKKGKDIKEKLSGVKASHMAKKNIAMAQMPTILATLKEKGYEPKERGKSMEYNEEMYPMFSYKMTDDYYKDQVDNFPDDECRKMMQDYNDLVYTVEGIDRDVKIIDIMTENMDDKKSYDLNIRQLATLEKGEEGDDLNKAMKGAQDKVGKVMGEFKAGTLKHGSTGKKVTDKKVALAIAMSEAGISKKDLKKKSIRKFFQPGWLDYDVEGVKENEETQDADTKPVSKIKKADVDNAFETLGV